MVYQKEIRLQPLKYGLHLITEKIMTEIRTLPQQGIVNIFLQHTSAGLTINENADPEVRHDMELFLDHIVPEGFRGFKHVCEGADDMPAHIKASLFGQSLSIPVVNGRLALGQWQGIYLCEFRRHGGPRRLIITIMGE